MKRHLSCSEKCVPIPISIYIFLFIQIIGLNEASTWRKSSKSECLFISTIGFFVMANKKALTERRKHERFKVKNGAIAIIRLSNVLGTTQKYGQIINISQGGLTFRYIDRTGESNEPVKLDLLFIQDSICSTYLKYLSSKTIWVSHLDSKTSVSELKIKQQGVQFDKMVPNQITQLDRFLEKCTIR